MKKIDFIIITVVTLLLLLLIMDDNAYNYYTSFNKNHSYIMAFIKFALLATFGETIGKRITTKKYLPKGFGLIPKAVIWGFLGLTIKAAFVIFATGVPLFISSLGFDISIIENTRFSFNQILLAFSISALMNIIYAPIMMTFHKITDIHIMYNNGKIRSLLKPINFTKILTNLDWDRQYNFVFKKTIPFFWIPAHTITFLLPTDFRVVFAAFLGIALGVILSIANKKTSEV